MIDITRKANIMQKKTQSFMAAFIQDGVNVDLLEDGESYLLAKLPTDIMITDAYLFVNTPSNAATAATISLGRTEGATNIMTAQNTKIPGKKGTVGNNLFVRPGQEVYMNVVKTGAETQTAEFLVVIEYLEFSKNCGDYTDIN